MSHLVQGDDAVIKVTLKDAETKTVKDLTGLSVYITWRIEGRDAVTKQMTVTNASGGECQYIMNQSDLVQGKMTFEVYTVDSSGLRQTTPRPRKLTVRDRVS